MPPVRNFINLPDDSVWARESWNMPYYTTESMEDVFSVPNSTATNTTNVREWSIDYGIDFRVDTIIFGDLPSSDDRANNNIEVASEDALLDIINTD